MFRTTGKTGTCMLMQPTSPTTEPRNVLIVVTTDVEPGESSIPKLEGANVRVVAPLTQLSRLQWLANDEDAERVAAGLRADHIANQVTADADTVASDTDDVILAIKDALQEFAADEILIVTSPDADKSWLEEGASLKAVAAFNLPVARVVVDTSGKAGDSTPATTQ